VSYLQDAMLCLGVYYTPARILSLGTSSGKTGLHFFAANPPFIGDDMTTTPQPLWSDERIEDEMCGYVHDPHYIDGAEIVAHAMRDEYEAELLELSGALVARITELIRLRNASAAALGWIEEYYPASVFDGSSGDEGPVRIVAIRENLRQALRQLKEREP
jgi:hypothetical protein